MENTLLFKAEFLGGCRLTCGDVGIDDTELRSKKIWELLAYLIIYRNKEIGQGELVGLIYGEDKSANPVNALKTLMHRVRAALDKMGAVPGKDLILQNNGSYKWNNEYPVELDTEVFEDCFSTAQSVELDADRRLEAVIKAVDTYKGDFLPRFAMEPWVIPVNTYYRSCYIRLVHGAVALLAEQGKNAQMVEICQRAIGIDPYDEYLYLSLMQGLVNLGQYRNAMDQYEKTTSLFYKEFGVTPSEELKALYRQIVRTSQSVEADIGTVKERLRESDDLRGAFCCEYEFFKDIYQLEVRSASRTGKPVHIGLLTVNPREDGKMSVKTMNSAVERLMGCVRQTLRRGDVFARYSVSQIIVMLPLTTMENADAVLSRVVKRFRAENPRSTAEIGYSFQPIDAVL